MYVCITQKIIIAELQNMKNHAVSGLKRKAQKDKLDNFVFFFFAEHAEHEKSCSLWFDTEGTKRQT
jgi:hypothetical protein